VLTGQHLLVDPLILASSSVHGSIAAVAMGLAFFPPLAYRALFAGSREVEPA
jgi:hypothetical protein